MLSASNFKDFIVRAREKNKAEETQKTIIRKKFLEEQAAVFFDSIISKIIYVAGIEDVSSVKLPFEGDLEDYIPVIKANYRTERTFATQEEVCSISDKAKIMKYMFSKENINRVETLLKSYGYHYFYEQGLFRTWFCIEIPS